MRRAVDQEVTGRLMVVLGGEWRGEMPAHEVGPHEEGVDAIEVAAHQAIPEFRSQQLERLQARAIVLGAIPALVGGVPDLPVHGRRDRRVVFHRDNARPITSQPIPHVVGVLVDVERQQVELLRHAEAGKQAIGILAINKAAKPFQAIGPVRDQALRQRQEAVVAFQPIA